MMEHSRELAIRFKEVILDGKWVATTNLKEQLSDVNWIQATKKVGSLNTIALLTFHIHYYISGVLQVLEGGPLEIRDQFSFDAPPIESEKDWEALKQKLYADSDKFAKHVAALSNKDLSQEFVKKEYGSYRRNLDGMIEHCYYHFGQIVLLKKLVVQ